MVQVVALPGHSALVEVVDKTGEAYPLVPKLKCAPDCVISETDDHCILGVGDDKFD